MTMAIQAQQPVAQKHAIEKKEVKKENASITFTECWNGEKSLTSTAARYVGMDSFADWLEDKDKVCTDVGSSTGGFTDCMLQNGAKKVFAIDVGRGQLAWKLRQDERVVCMEKTNIRYVTPEDLGETIDFSSIDVSFISLTKVLLPIRNYLKDDGQIVALIKPQFEAGREKVGKKGVVREKSTHYEVIEMILSYATSIGFEILNLDFSPIKGPEGNIEYLVHLQKTENVSTIDNLQIDWKDIVEQAFESLAK